MRRAKESASHKLLLQQMQQRAAQWEEQCELKDKAYQEADKLRRTLAAELDVQHRALMDERGRRSEVSVTGSQSLAVSAN